MCPKVEGISVEFSLVMPGKILECSRHFCRPRDKREALELLRQVVFGMGCAALECVPTDVLFGFGLCVSPLEFKQDDSKLFSLDDLPVEIAAYSDTFTMRPAKGRKPGRR